MSARLGHYRLEEAIGVGSFATVHRAVDERLDDVVAIKVLAENHSLNLEIRERFLSEGRALRRVGGDHCAVVHDIGESERTQPYLVMEHADRGTVRDRVQELRARGWRATDADVLALARSLAAGVHDVHHARLVHRDLSPGNLLLTSRRPVGITADAGAEPSALLRPDERLLLADLGLCKDLAMNSGLTVGGGTSGFRPPEQEGPGVVDIRADIWAMSALLVWLLADAPTPPALREALERGMAPSPEDRPADARAWLDAVEDALRPAPLVPDPPASTAPQAAEGAASAAASPWHAAPPSHAEPPGRARGTRLTRVLALAVAPVALVVGGIAGWQLADDEPQASSDGASLAIDGPSEVTVGEEVVFTADVDGVESWAWTLPTDRNVADEQQVSVTPTSPGSAEIVLRSRAPDGEDLQVAHTFRVVEK